MKKNIAICWFRQDLRLSDNPALSAASNHENILPIYILDKDNSGENYIGEASKLWLHHSLTALKKSLNGKLWIASGDPIVILSNLIETYSIKAVYWNRCYEPWRIKRDKKIKNELSKKNIIVKTYNGSLLWEPWEIRKDDGSPYKVFTPFYRKAFSDSISPRKPLQARAHKNLFYEADKNVNIEDLNLLPNNSWDSKIKQHWGIGEKAATARFSEFMEHGIENYQMARDFPSVPSVSRISPHIHFGEISPNYMWHMARSKGYSEQIDLFCKQLGWREFSYSQLYFNPDLPKENLQTKFDNFPWENNAVGFEAWTRGITGIPLVDAGMRELWNTGYMHNRVRMIVGSFLVKNLLIHWRKGERWFWDTLVDADLANNAAGWQWVAGCGSDAAPYFRIFNPVSQAKKFDPEGRYIRKYLPELSKMPDKFLFSPWEAPEDVLANAGVALGVNYPLPVVDLKLSRERALKSYKLIS